MSLLPIDFTLLTALLGFGAAGLLFLTAPISMSDRGFVAWLLMATIAIVGSISAGASTLGAEKEISLYLLTLPMSLTMAIAVSSVRHFRHFVLWFSGWAAYASLALLVVGRADVSGRLVGELGTTISFGRAGAVVLIVMVAHLMSVHRLVRKEVVLLGIIFLLEVFVLVSVASRGPIQGAITGSLAIVLARALRARAGDGRRILVLGTLLGVGLSIVWSLSPGFSRRRVLTLVEAIGGDSGVRGDFYRWTIANLPSRPQGNGWGSWPEASGFTSFRYPHNIFLEVWFEAGVVGLLALIAVIALALRHKGMLVGRDSFAGLSAIGLVVLWVSMASVSGDVNDNRALFVLLVAASSLPRPQPVPSAPPAESVRFSVPTRSR